MTREGLDMSFRPVAGPPAVHLQEHQRRRHRGRRVRRRIRGDAVRSAFAGAYTYLDARDDVTDLPLTGRSQHQGSVRATWRHQRSGFTANLRGMFLSEWVAARATVAGQAGGYAGAGLCGVGRLRVAARRPRADGLRRGRQPSRTIRIPTSARCRRPGRRWRSIAPMSAARCAAAFVGRGRSSRHSGVNR